MALVGPGPLLPTCRSGASSAIGLPRYWTDELPSWPAVAGLLELPAPPPPEEVEPPELPPPPLGLPEVPPTLVETKLAILLLKFDSDIHMESQCLLVRFCGVGIRIN